MANFSTYSDQALLELYFDGDVAAYEAIYDRYWQLLFRFSRKLLQDSDGAEDVVQEVFLTFWAKKGSLTVNTPLAPYLYKLTKNKILDLVKHLKVELRYLDHLRQAIQQTEALPDEAYMARELYDLIEQEIRNLPEKMRRVFEMGRKEYKTNKKIAEELGLSEQTVKNQMGKAMRTLKGRFGDSFMFFLMFF